MTPSHGNAFRTTGPLRGKPPVTIALHKYNNAEFWFAFDVSLNKQPSCRSVRDAMAFIWHHCNEQTFSTFDVYVTLLFSIPFVFCVTQNYLCHTKLFTYTTMRVSWCQINCRGWYVYIHTIDMPPQTLGGEHTFTTLKWFPVYSLASSPIFCSFVYVPSQFGSGSYLNV